MLILKLMIIIFQYMPLQCQQLTSCEVHLNHDKHVRYVPGSIFSVTLFNKDIIDCDTLLLIVSPTPIWHPLEK